MTDPKHKYVFEIFYHLGENRTLAKLTRIQMTKLHPDLEPDSEEYKKKYTSAYAKYRRWAEKEKWHEEAQKRRENDASRRIQVIQNEEDTLSNTIQLYRSMIRFMLQEFAERVSKNAVQIKTPKEAKQMIELDMYLSQLIDRRPKAIKAQVMEMMTETERRGADKVFEWLHKRATRAEAIDDLAEVVEMEQEIKEHRQTERLLTPPPPEKEKEPVTQNLEEAEAVEKYRIKKELARKRRLERAKRMVRINHLEDSSNTNHLEDSRDKNHLEDFEETWEQHHLEDSPKTREEKTSVENAVRHIYLENDDSKAEGEKKAERPERAVVNPKGNLDTYAHGVHSSNTTHNAQGVPSKIAKLKNINFFSKKFSGKVSDADEEN